MFWSHCSGEETLHSFLRRSHPKHKHRREAADSFLPPASARPGNAPEEQDRPPFGDNWR